ncbi:MAG: phospho-N-acetylmuramoyl-pentapeptide-transferase [Chlamydiae bacterium]|nr:phospho-N-acetylmuramoyl-pentapeptide-transferase [Chlamydiota bacterium]
MLLFFLEILQNFAQVKLPLVFYYCSTRMLLAALTTLVVTIVAGPWFIAKLFSLKTGQSIRVEDCPLLAQLHEKKKNTPSMGGLLMLFAILISAFLWMDLTSSFTLILIVTTLWLGILGGIDDYLKMRYKNSKGLKGKYKFLLQCLLATGLALYLFVPGCSEVFHGGRWFAPPIAKDPSGQLLSLSQYQGLFYLPFKKAPLFILTGGGLFLAYFIALFVVTGTSNAVNLSDGLDGLASGLILMVAAVLASVAFLSNHQEISKYLHILYIEGSGEIAIFLCAVFGACLGFLWYNGYPAQVFMGDVGSISLGGLLGVSAVLLRKEFLLALVGIVFVAEALSVMLQVVSFKFRRGKRIFLCAPLHHHFEYKGWPETKVVARFWIVGLIFALLGLASLKFQ